jgi:predicted RNA-binding protein YlqC (UPF0109 family)
MDFNLSTSEIMLELIRKMVSTPEAVTLTVRESASGVIYHIAASPEDMGAIIGKQGRTARSLRILLHSIAMKHGQRIILDIGPKNEADQI